MRDARFPLAVVLVFVGVVLQVTVVTRLPLPGEVVPDLVLVLVAALALRMGALRGCLIGFGAGLLADIAPPAYHTIGQYALVYCVVGYVVGLAKEEIEDAPVLSTLAVALGALGGTLLYTALGAIFGDPRITGAALTRVMPLSVLYDLILSPFVLFVVVWLVDRVDPDRIGWRRLRDNRPSP